MTGDSKVRVAYFAEIFPSTSETWVNHEIAALLQRGHAVRVFATHPRPSAIPAEFADLVSVTTYLPEMPRSYLLSVGNVLRPSLLIPVLTGLLSDASSFRLKAQVLRDAIYAGRLKASVAAFKPGLLYAHFAATRCSVAMFISFLSGVPFAFKMHANDVFVRVALFRQKMAKAAAVLSISDYNVQYIRTNYPDVDSTRIEKHTCGIPLSRYQLGTMKGSGSVPLIVSVGRLVPMKGLRFLVEASRRLLDRGFNHQVVIFGDGPQRSALMELAKNLRVGEAVKFAGYASPAEVQAALSRATAFALPAIWDPVGHTQDGIPVAIMEAMAVGVPVVSTTISGIPELIENGKSGFLVPPGDSAALATAIAGICSLDPAEREQLVREARRRIEESHDGDVLADSFIEIVRRCDRSSPETDGGSRSR
jgi:glycosyltransferase involved in cell wall biosynthesis